MSKEKPEKKKYSKGDFLLLLLILVVAVIAYAYVERTPSSTSSSSTSFNYVSLRETDFNLTYSAGCLALDSQTGRTFEHFTVTVTNRLNEPAHYVNASIYVANIMFSDDRFISDSLPPMLEAGPTDNATITFPVNFPITGAYYGKGYENTHVMSGLFAVFISIRQYDHVEYFPVLPSIPVSSSAPTCST